MDRHNIDKTESGFLISGDKPFRSLDELKTPRGFTGAVILIILLISGITLGLIYIPWQQSVTGTGRVFIASPDERPQNIEAQIPARIVKWNVQEGQIVNEGEIVAEIEDIDSKFLDKSQISRLRAQLTAQQSKLEAAKTRAAALENQIKNVSRSRGIALPTAAEKAKQNEDKLRAARQSIELTTQALKTNELNKTRIQELHSQGLRSKRDLEIAELDAVRAETELKRANAAYEVARRDLTIGDFDQQKVEADTSATLNSLQAARAGVNESIATIESDMLKLDIELQNTSERRTQNTIKAPCSGQIVRLVKIGTGATVKPGDVLAVISPITENKAVELLLSDNDAPLVSVGRQVRLQFAGFPAVQFVGVPELAVGTFAGRIAVIDPIDDGKNRYRVIVVPDWDAINSGRESAWASNKILRPGSEATGWIMLDTVPLGFELWRQFNGFPPSAQQEPLGKRSDEKKLETDIDLEKIFKK
jgi:membrane fusion protein, adhesin transport system